MNHISFIQNIQITSKQYLRVRYDSIENIIKKFNQSISSLEDGSHRLGNKLAACCFLIMKREVGWSLLYTPLVCYITKEEKNLIYDFGLQSRISFFDFNPFYFVYPFSLELIKRAKGLFLKRRLTRWILLKRLQRRDDIMLVLITLIIQGEALVVNDRYDELPCICRCAKLQRQTRATVDVYRGSKWPRTSALRPSTVFKCEIKPDHNRCADGTKWRQCMEVFSQKTLVLASIQEKRIIQPIRHAFNILTF